jgi:hypothetical protein
MNDSPVPEAGQVFRDQQRRHVHLRAPDTPLQQSDLQKAIGKMRKSKSAAGQNPLMHIALD